MCFTLKKVQNLLSNPFCQSPSFRHTMIKIVMPSLPWHNFKKHSLKKVQTGLKLSPYLAVICKHELLRPVTQGWLTTGSLPCSQKSSSVRPFVDNSSVPWKVQHKHTCMLQMFLDSPQQSRIKKEKDKKDRGLSLKVCKKTGAHSGTAQLLNGVAQLTL